MIKGRKILANDHEEKEIKTKIKGRKILFKKHIQVMDVKPVIATTMAGVNHPEPVIKSSIAGVTNIKKIDKKKGSRVPSTIFAIIMFLLGFYVINDQFFKEKKYDEVDNYSYNITKIDNTKDLIYYQNESDIITIDGTTYTYKDIIMNIDNDIVINLNEEINKQNSEFKNDYLTANNTEEECPYVSSFNTDTECLIDFTYRTYYTYETDNYLTVVLVDTNKSLITDVDVQDTSSYIFNKHTGLFEITSDLLDDYNTSYEELAMQIIENYNLSQDLIDTIIEDGISLYIDNNDTLGIYFKLEGQAYNLKITNSN